MDSLAWSDHVAPWLACRAELPVGALFCVIDGPTRGRPWSATTVRGELRRYALAAGVPRRFAPHQLRHAHAVELAREGVPLPVIQRRLGHSYVSTTSAYCGHRYRGDHRDGPRASRSADARQRRS
jgi:site-specific recombinase XerD